MAWQTSNRVMEIRAKNHYFDIFVEMLDGWRRHLSGRNASLLAFFTFLSIFPLMLAAVTILGFVLEGNEDLQKRIIDGAAADIPVVGASIADDPQALTGNLWALIIGLGGALWSSTKAFVGLQGALDDTWEVPVDDRAGLPVQRGRAIVGLMIIGTAQIGSLVIASTVSAAALPGISQILLTLATVVINILIIAAMFRFLTEASPTWLDVWPGAILAGIIFSILQRVGPEIVKSIAESNAAYETFGVVIGLVTWLGFVAIATLMAAELNAAIVRRRNAVPYPTMGADFDLPVRS
jgi:membrane protein